MLQRDAPRLHGFGGVTRPQDHHVRHRAKTRQLLDGLMGRAVLPQRDAVVGPDVDHARLAQRREPDARTHVVGEREERRAEREHPAVERHAGQRGGHGVLAKAEVNVAARVAPDAARRALCRQRVAGLGRQRALEVAASGHRGARRRIEIRRSADQVRHDASQRLDDRASGVACRHLAVRRREDRQVRLPALGQFAGKRARESCRQVGVRDRVRVDAAPPRRLEFRAPLDGRAKLAQGLVRHIEAAIFGPSQRALGQAHFFDAERLAVRVPRVLLVRAAVADMRARHDERRPIAGGSRRGQRRIDGRHVLPVDPLHVPAAGLEARADVLRKRQVRRRGERDQVRVVEHDQRPSRSVPASDAASDATPSIRSPSLART